MNRFFALVIALVLLSVIAFVGSAAADPPGDGAFVVNPPGLGGGSTASCVGPVFGGTPNTAPWNGHFNSDGVVEHDTACDPV